jgi:ribonuclease HII
MQKLRYIIGIDEAGRGPLAGPVVVGGVRLNLKNKISKLLSGIKDSKKLSAKQREVWFAKLTAHHEITWAVARVYPKTIDRINISRATNLGAWRVYRALSANNESGANKRMERSSANNEFETNKRAEKKCIRKFVKNSLFVDGEVLLDGGLYLPKHIPQKTIIKGDEKIPVISAASIIAKVTRDRLMSRLHKKYPQYRFDIHKGYGTKLHRAMLKKYGRSEAHRKSFRF